MYQGSTISAGIRTCRCPLEKPSIWTDRLSWIPRCRTRDPGPRWFSLRRPDQGEAGNGECCLISRSALSTRLGARLNHSPRAVKANVRRRYGGLLGCAELRHWSLGCWLDWSSPDPTLSSTVVTFEALFAPDDLTCRTKLEGKVLAAAIPFSPRHCCGQAIHLQSRAVSFMFPTLSQACAT